MVDYKRNHYVPVSLLERFRSADNKLYYFDIRKPNAAVKHRNPKSVFYIKDFYVSEDANGHRDTSLESEFYNRLETDSKNIFDKIIANVRVGETLSVTSEEIDITQNFIASQMIRAPEFLRDLESENDEIFQKSMNNLEWAYGPFWKTVMEKNKTRMLQTGKCDVLKSPKYLKNIYNAIKSKGLYVAKIQEQNCQFLIGSNPCVKFQFKGDNLGSPLTELYLPISHDIAIIPCGPPTQILVIPIAEKIVSSVNKAIASQSDEIAGSFKEMICKYAQEMKERDKLQ